MEDIGKNRFEILSMQSEGGVSHIISAMKVGDGVVLQACHIAGINTTIAMVHIPSAKITFDENGGKKLT